MCAVPEVLTAQSWLSFDRVSLRCRLSTGSLVPTCSPSAPACQEPLALLSSTSWCANSRRLLLHGHDDRACLHIAGRSSHYASCGRLTTVCEVSKLVASAEILLIGHAHERVVLCYAEGRKFREHAGLLRGIAGELPHINVQTCPSVDQTIRLMLSSWRAAVPCLQSSQRTSYIPPVTGCTCTPLLKPLHLLLSCASQRAGVS